MIEKNDNINWIVVRSGLPDAIEDMNVPGTSHGFRSAFKDWAAEPEFRDEVLEAALAHADTNRVRAV